MYLIKKIKSWLPSHVGIRDNEKADPDVKSALDLPRVKVRRIDPTTDRFKGGHAID